MGSEPAASIWFKRFYQKPMPMDEQEFR